MSAWKYGVRKASGEVVGFVDSDDWVDEKALKELLSVILSIIESCQLLLRNELSAALLLLKLFLCFLYTSLGFLFCLLPGFQQLFP